MEDSGGSLAVAREGREPRTLVLRSLRQWIESGRVARGEPLPSERRLAHELGVARKTVRAAISQLTAEGLLAPSRARSRRLVGDAAPAAPRSRLTGPYVGLGSSGGGAGLSLLGRTVAVVSDALPRLLHENRTPGLDLFIQSEAMRLIQGEGLHVLNVNPDHLRPASSAASVAAAGVGVPDMSVGHASLQSDIGVGAEELLRARPYGLLMTYNIGESPLGQALARRCREEGVPCVVYGDGPQLETFDRVTSDHAAGAASLVRWLADRGRRRILRFWRFASERNWLSQRNLGFDRAVAERGLELLPAVRTPNLPREHDIEVPGDASRERFGTLVRILAGFLLEHFSPANRDRWPDAIMVATDRHAYQVAGALRLLGVTPGKDVTLVGYDNVFEDAVERHFEAVGPAATIDKRNDRIAHQLARLLIDRGAGRVPSEPQRRAVEGELIETDEGE